MLLALLIDRFGLKYHREMKEGRVYLLERGSGALKLRAPARPTEFPWVGGVEGGAIYLPTGIAGKNASMALLAERLGRYLSVPVIDQTSIAGSFDFEYKAGAVDPGIPVTRNDVISSILTSVKGLGLKLTPAKGPVETVVIDSVEQPSAN